MGIFKPGNNTRDSRRDIKGVEGRRNSSYLGRPSSGVPDLKGKQEHSQQRTRDCGKLCDTNTQASCAELRCLCYWREQRDGERQEGTQTGFHTMSIQSTGAGCNASSVTYASYMRSIFKSLPPCDWQEPPIPPTSNPLARPRSLNMNTVKGCCTFTLSVSCHSKSSDFQRDCATHQLTTLS